MNIFLDNKYTKTYYVIVNRAKSESRIKTTTSYYENHHIIPEHFYINRSRDGDSGWIQGNPESPENKVLLTFREHRLCHLLLRKMLSENTNKQGIYLAAFLMTTRKNEHDQYESISSRLYETVKIEAAKANSERDTSKWSGDNHWSRLDPERFAQIFRDIQNNLVNNGEHIFIKDNPNADGRNAKAAMKSGRHIYLANNPNIEKVKNGTHQMFRREDGSSIGNDANNKRLANGTHNWLGPKMNQSRIDSDTHNWLGSTQNEKMLAEGTHPSQSETSCLFCKWTVPTSMFKRWHGDNCHMNQNSRRYNPELKPRIKKKK